MQVERGRATERRPGGLADVDRPDALTFLVAEDHETLREALVMMLESAGFRVLGAGPPRTGRPS
jgi:hypothetical protein